MVIQALNASVFSSIVCCSSLSCPKVAFSVFLKIDLGIYAVLHELLHFLPLNPQFPSTHCRWKLLKWEVYWFMAQVSGVTGAYWRLLTPTPDGFGVSNVPYCWWPYHYLQESKDFLAKHELLLTCRKWALTQGCDTCDKVMHILLIAKNAKWQCAKCPLILICGAQKYRSTCKQFTWWRLSCSGECLYCCSWTMPQQKKCGKMHDTCLWLCSPFTCNSQESVTTIPSFCSMCSSPSSRP